MPQFLSLTLIAAGVVLLFFGVRAYDSVSSSLSRFFTDSPTDKAIWMLIVGSVALVVGIASLMRGGAQSA